MTSCYYIHFDSVKECDEFIKHIQLIEIYNESRCCSGKGCSFKSSKYSESQLHNLKNKFLGTSSKYLRTSPSPPRSADSDPRPPPPTSADSAPRPPSPPTSAVSEFIKDNLSWFTRPTNVGYVMKNVCKTCLQKIKNKIKICPFCRGKLN